MKKMRIICNRIALLYIMKKVRAMRNDITLMQSKNAIWDCFYFIFCNVALLNCQKELQFVD